MKKRKFNFKMISLTGIVFLTCMVIFACTPKKYKVNVIKPQEQSETEEKKNDYDDGETETKNSDEKA